MATAKVEFRRFTYNGKPRRVKVLTYGVNESNEAYLKGYDFIAKGYRTFHLDKIKLR